MVNPPLPNFIHTKLDLAHFTSPSHLRPQASTILRTTKSHIFSKDSGQHRLSNRYGNYTAESLIFCYSNYLIYFHQYDRHQADLRSSERDLSICLSVCARVLEWPVGGQESAAHSGSPRGDGPLPLRATLHVQNTGHAPQTLHPNAQQFSVIDSRHFCRPPLSFPPAVPALTKNLIASPPSECTSPSACLNVPQIPNPNALLLQAGTIGNLMTFHPQ